MGRRSETFFFSLSKVSPRRGTQRKANLVCLQWGFTGIASFAHLKHVKCLTNPGELYDIAIIGAPFDTATSYRPGKKTR